MEQHINSIEQLLSFLKNTKRYLSYIGTIYGGIFMNIYDFMPTFEMITCKDPYFGAHLFIKVP